MLNDLFCSDLCQFPFLSDVWGTASDWVMIFVTAITAFFLYKTLRSQLVVQAMQQQLIDIEAYRHKQNIRPEFRLRIKSIRENEENGHFKMTVFFEFKLNGNKANNVKISYKDEKDGWYINPKEPFAYDFILPNDSATLSAEYSGAITYDSANTPMFFIELFFVVDFEDELGNKYRQHGWMLKYNRSNNKTEMKSPELLSAETQ